MRKLSSRSSKHVWFILVGGAFAGAAACSSSDDPEPIDPIPDAGHEAEASLVGDTSLPDVTPDAAPPECPKCSSDLHHVIDCDGNVVKTCPDDMGCSPVTSDCVPACESARANQSTIGCEYYAVQPDGTSGLGGSVQAHSCFAAFIANTWTTPVTISVDRAGKSYDISLFARIPEGQGKSISYKPLVDGKLPPGQVAILFLSHGSWDLKCPGDVTPPGDGPTTVSTEIGDAFHITTDRPVVAYDIFPYGGGVSFIASATNLIPTSAWNTNYMAVDPYYTNRYDLTPLATQLVAQEDGTEITVVPTQDVPGSSVDAGKPAAAAPKNVATKYTLQKGQVLGLANLKGMTGTIIGANKPIGMWSSCSCIAVDEWTMACDSAHQQIPPIKSLGSEYVAVRYRNRVDGLEEAPPWRIMAVVDGTKLEYDPEIPSGAPSELNAGQLATFRSSGPFVVRSQDDQHPIYVSGHMTGSEVVWTPERGYVGGAEFVNVVPARQFLSSYVFFTDPTYPETNLVVVRARGKDGTFKDVTLDCAGPLTGWTPIGKGGMYEYTRIDLVRDDFVPQGSCDNGRHEIKSDAPFGVTVWAWGSAISDPNSEFVSYAYPVGASVRPINTVTVNPVPK